MPWLSPEVESIPEQHVSGVSLGNAARKEETRELGLGEQQGSNSRDPGCSIPRPEAFPGLRSSDL